MRSSGLDAIKNSTGTMVAGNASASPAKLDRVLTVGKELASVTAPTKALIPPSPSNRVSSKRSCGSIDGGGLTKSQLGEDAVEDSAQELQWLQTADELLRNSPISSAIPADASLAVPDDDAGQTNDGDAPAQGGVPSQREGESAATPHGGRLCSESIGSQQHPNSCGDRSSFSHVNIDFRRDSRAQSRPSFVTAGAAMAGVSTTSSADEPLRRRSRVSVALTRRGSVNRLVTTINPNDLEDGGAGANGAPHT
jgi:hypothetical protein